MHSREAERSSLAQRLRPTAVLRQPLCLKPVPTGARAAYLAQVGMAAAVIPR